MFLGHLLFRPVPTGSPERVCKRFGGTNRCSGTDLYRHWLSGNKMIDGAFGMAYGPDHPFLMVMGISPAIASATLHTAEAHLRRELRRHHITATRTLTSNSSSCLPLRESLVQSYASLCLVSKDQLSIVAACGALYLNAGRGRYSSRAQFRSASPGRKISLDSRSRLCGGFFDSIGGGGFGARL